MSFLKSAIGTWTDLERSFRTSYQLGEETITDHLILNWKEQLSNSLVSMAHTRRREGKTGADWEWWFIAADGSAFGMRVQAKVMTVAQHQYLHLHRSKTRKKPKKLKVYQCEVLIEAAAKASPPLFPVYLLYSWWEDGASTSPRTYRPSTVTGEYGCGLLGVETVRKLRPNNDRHVLRIGPALRPLHELVCPSQASARGLAAQVARNVSEMGFGVSELEDLPEATDLVAEAAPHYVLSLLELGATTLPSGTRGVLVFSENGG